MNEIKQKIYDTLEFMQKNNEALIATLTDKVSLDEYAALVKADGERELWADALQKALDEHEVVVIPAREKPYYIEKQVIIGSNRRIEATGATMIQPSECTVLMLRNKSTMDGTHTPIPEDAPKDTNISINGGRWEEDRNIRAGYGKTGKYDDERSFFGVSTLFLFNNMENLSVTNAIFARTAGFAVQAGDIKNCVFENIEFDSCWADGLHINGNTKNVICRNIRGEVGDDLVALNVYDWQNSSIDFGPMDTVLCDGLDLAPSSGYKALRIEPGTYYFDDNSEVDCALTNAIIKNVKGIWTFKLYYQTPGYFLGNPPERGAVGSADNLFFEDIVVDLKGPIDAAGNYLNSDPIRGNFGAFEFGANVGYICFENIDLTLYKEKYPLSYLACFGPKSILEGTYEVFDPYLSSSVEHLELKNITVNGKIATDVNEIVKEVQFDDINKDGNSSGKGEIKMITLDGKRVK